MHPKCFAQNRTEFRDWFKKNHKKENIVYLISYKKHTKKPSLSHRESMEEAICFGWIDTIIKKIDNDTYSRCFVKRNKNSRWSNNTLSYAKQLVKEKKMTIHGLKMYEEGLKKPTIDHNLPRNPETPEDLKIQLKKHNLENNFNNLAPSSKRLFIYQIERAKRLETRNKRISETTKSMKEKN